MPVVQLTSPWTLIATGPAKKLLRTDQHLELLFVPAGENPDTSTARPQTIPKGDYRSIGVAAGRVIYARSIAEPEVLDDAAEVVAA